MRAVWIAIVLAAGSAAAEPQPWRVGVSADDERRAQALLDEGNALFLDKHYPEALDRYRAAVAVWDHPAIRFNIVRCLIFLDRPVEAAENLERALAYGAAPLEDTVYQEALSYQRLLARQIGDLELACTQVGVTVSLDGQPAGRCPLELTRRVTPGRHQVVASKPGFATRSFELVVAGADRQRVAIALEPVKRAARVVHRWPTWRPWVVFGSGFVVAGLGGLLQRQALGNMDRYDRELRERCARGCAPGEVDDGPRATAERQNAIAIGIISAGAAAAITGGVMLYLNRGRTVYDEPRVTVAPRPGGAALAITARF